MVVRASRNRYLLVAFEVMYMFAVQWVDYTHNALTVGSHPAIQQWVTLMCLGAPVLYLVGERMLEGWVNDGAVMLLTVTVAALMLYVVPEKLRVDRNV